MRLHNRYSCTVVAYRYDHGERTVSTYITPPFLITSTEKYISELPLAEAAASGSLSHSARNPFTRLPMELVRKVFELAACYPPTACSLCAVSRDVYSWVAPILYCRIIESGWGCNWLIGSHYAKWITNLWVAEPGPLISLQPFTRLEQLVLRAYSPRGLEVVPATVTHLTINHIYLKFNTSLRSITHLHLLKVGRPFQRHYLDSAELPHLTHVVWTLNRLPTSVELDSHLGPLMKLGYDKLKVIGMQGQCHWPLSRYEEELESAVRASPFCDNEKIVIMPGYVDFTMSDWFLGGEDVWQKAERLLSQSLFRPVAEMLVDY